MGCSMNTPTRTVGRASSCMGAGGGSVKGWQCPATGPRLSPYSGPRDPEPEAEVCRLSRKGDLGQAAPSSHVQAGRGRARWGSRRRKSQLGRACLDLEAGPADGLLSEGLAGMGWK